MKIPAGFVRLRTSGYHCLVREDVRAWVEPAIARLEDVSRLTQTLAAAGTGPAGSEASQSAALPLPEGNGLMGGRGGVVLLAIDAQRVVVRPCRRGGIPGLFLRDVYFGIRPRPFAELARTEGLRQAGVPVPEIYAAVVAWLAPGCYQGWVLSRFLEGSETLWSWARRDPSATQRQEVWRAVGIALRRLHATGMGHPDLNLQNVLVAPAAVPKVWLIDFDRSAWVTRRGADLRRLRRSVAKLDPSGRFVRDGDLACLRQAYEEAPCV